MKAIRSMIVILAFGAAIVGCGPKTYTLRINPQAGDSFTYVTKVTATQSMEMSMTMKATKVEGDKVTFETRMGDVKVGGQSVPQIAAMTKDMVVTTVMDRTGHTLSSDVTGASGPLGEQMKHQNMANSTNFPDKALSVGETWSGETDLQGKKVKTTTKLASVADEGGKQVATLEANMEVPDLTMKGPMIIKIDLATGMPISMAFEGESKGQTVKVEMNRA